VPKNHSGHASQAWGSLQKRQDLRFKRKEALAPSGTQRLDHIPSSVKERSHAVDIVLAHCEDVEALYSVRTDSKSPHIHGVEKTEAYNVAYRLAIEIARQLPKERRKEVVVMSD
jgi:hypothetical protein